MIMDSRTKMSLEHHVMPQRKEILKKLMKTLPKDTATLDGILLMKLGIK